MASYQLYATLLGNCTKPIVIKPNYNKEISVALISQKLNFILFVFFYTSTKSWRGYIFIAVCLCICVSVCVCVGVSGILVNTIPAERMHRFGRDFR